MVDMKIGQEIMITPCIRFQSQDASNSSHLYSETVDVGGVVGKLLSLLRADG